MIKKICAFSQTYGNSRNELYRYLTNNKLSIDFRNEFDLNIYSFHNSDRDYIDTVKNKKYFQKLKNLEFKEYNDIGYTQVIRDVLYELLERGYEYFFYLQDDSFTCGIEYDFSDLIEFIKTNDFNILYLEATGKELNNETIYYEKNDLKIYNTTTQDFFNRNGWAIDDGAQIGKISYLLEHVYDDEYFSIGCIQKGESFLNSKISKLKLERLTTNIKLYRRYSIVGPNAQWDEEGERKMLNERFSSPQSSFIKLGSKIIPRNVRNSRRRN
jgi:hypothetical protein